MPPQRQKGPGSLKNIIPLPQYIVEIRTIGRGPSLAGDCVVVLDAKESLGSHRVPAYDQKVSEHSGTNNSRPSHGSEA